MSAGSAGESGDLARLVEELTQLTDLEERLVRSTAWLEELRQRQLVVVGVRDAAMQGLHQQGRSYAEIARAARMTRGRVAQIVTARRAGADAPEPQ